MFQSIYNGGDGETSLNFQTENVTDTSTTTYHKNYMKRKSKERCVRFDDRKMCQLYNKVVILFKNINTIDLYGKYIVWVLLNPLYGMTAHSWTCIGLHDYISFAA